MLSWYLKISLGKDRFENDNFKLSFAKYQMDAFIMKFCQVYFNHMGCPSLGLASEVILKHMQS